VTVEDRAHADAGLDEHDQAEQPEREPVSAKGIVDALGKKLIDHVGPRADTARAS
jgi:hypothetical protein